MSKELLPYKIRLTKKQGELLKSFRDSMKTEILFGGGGRGGKTWGIAEIICYTCVSQPGIVWGIGRNEWEDLRKSSLLTVTKVLNSHEIRKDEHYSLNMQTKELLFINGSKIFFIPLKQQPSDPEFNFLGGYELTHGFVDEAQEVSRKAIDVFKTRFTEKIVEYGINPKLIMACNPMHGHLYYDFIKADEDGTLKPDRVFIQSLYKDNPFLDHAKYEAQYANADKITKERLLKGNWKYDQTPGRLFEFDALSDLPTNARNNGDKFLSVDVAREGKDSTVIFVWDGLEVVEIITEAKSKMDELSTTIRAIAHKYQIGSSRIIADENGVGGGLIDNLRCQGFINNARPLQPKSPNLSQVRNFENLKTQCYHELAKLVNARKIRVNSDAVTLSKLIEELDAVVQVDIDKDGKYKIIRKEDVKQKIGRSPDYSDAMMMRMAYEIRKFSIVEEAEEVKKEDDPLELFIDDEEEDEFDDSVY